MKRDIRDYLNDILQSINTYQDLRIVILSEAKDLNYDAIFEEILRFAQNDKIRPFTQPI
jgi:hypothetical protein